MMNMTWTLVLLLVVAIFVGIGCFVAPGIGLIIFFSIRKARSAKAEAAEVVEGSFTAPDAVEGQEKADKE